MSAVTDVRAARAAEEAAKGREPLPIQERLGAFVSDSYTVTAADDTAGAATIATGLEKVTSFTYNIRTALNVVVPLTDLVVSSSGGNIVFEDGAATDAVTDTWIIDYVARGY